MSPPRQTLFFAWIFLFFVQAALAHEGFEITSVARLQHGRLEVGATMNLRLGGALLAEGNDPEFVLAVDNFEKYQARLGSAAMSLFEVTAGGQKLAPLGASASLPEAGHLRFTIVYPEPPSWPLKFRPGNVAGMPTSAVTDLNVYDEGEKLLGTTVMVLRDPNPSELSVDPAAPVSMQAAPLPSPDHIVLATVTTAVSAHAMQPSWLNIAFGAAFGMFTLLILIFAGKHERPPTP